MLTGCSATTHDNQDNLISWDQMNKEYLNAVAQFPYALPAGVEFPADAEPQTETRAGYETGYGAMDAYLQSRTDNRQ
jgi:hypothetical protein